jgi:hypothetical protein
MLASVLVGSLRATRSACDTAVIYTSRNIQAVNRIQSRPTNLCQKLNIIRISVIASVKGWRVRLLVKSLEGIG